MGICGLKQQVQEVFGLGNGNGNGAFPFPRPNSKTCLGVENTKICGLLESVFSKICKRFGLRPTKKTFFTKNVTSHFIKISLD